MRKFNICVIGGGPSGYAAAMRAHDFKKSVILIERDKVGGAGVYNGALSSKTMWELAREYANLQKRSKKYGGDGIRFSFSDMMNEVKEAVFERKSILENHLYWLQKTTPSDLFALENGSARLLSAHQVEITKADQSTEIIEVDHVILATGSRPRYLPNVPIDEKIVVTSDGIHSFTEFPKSLLIVGAGVIGCEFATIFSNFGRTKVYMIAREDRILPFEDADVSSIIEKNMEASGVTLFKNAGLGSMEINDGVVDFTIQYKNGFVESHRVERALISVGRVPNLENLGIEQIGVKLNQAGHIEDDDTRTNVPNIYAVGDLTADIALVNVGELEGRHAVEKIVTNTIQKLEYDNISTIMFLNPEAAGVGLNEQQAKKAGLNYKVVSLDYSCIARAVAMRNTQGFFKILVTDDNEMKILGMRALGEHASSAIQAVALLISMNKGIEELAELIHPHPSIIEGVQECVRALLGKSIFKPEAILDALNCKRCVQGVYEELIHAR
jgi:dihydrolipoamide dehydrogenase